MSERQVPVAEGQETIVGMRLATLTAQLREMATVGKARNDPTLSIALSVDTILALLDRLDAAAPQPEPSAGLREAEAYAAGRLAGFEEGLEAAALSVERLARAISTYHSTAVKDRHTNSWSRPDPYDAAAIAAQYDRLTAEDAP